MPYATNPLDGVRTYVEDWGGPGPPVLVYAGLADPIAVAQRTGLVEALRPENRLVFADHRGHGRSDKPHAAGAYALPTRVADVVAVLDLLGLDRVHFLGLSWGARLGFAVAHLAPQRLRSLALCGNQPYAWDPAWPFVPALTAALERARTAQTEGMAPFVDLLQAVAGEPLPESALPLVLDNDPVALDAAWRAALAEGAIADDVSGWSTPCLIWMADGEDMADAAARAAAAMPDATLLLLPGHTHLSAPDEVDRVLPAVRALLARADRGTPGPGRPAVPASRGPARR